MALWCSYYVLPVKRDGKLQSQVAVLSGWYFGTPMSLNFRLFDMACQMLSASRSSGDSSGDFWAEIHGGCSDP